MLQKLTIKDRRGHMHNLYRRPSFPDRNMGPFSFNIKSKNP